jgi:hypothetical protein
LTATASTSTSRPSTDGGQLGDVHEVEVELDHLVEARPDRLERGLEVLEHLPRLGADVTGADQLAGTVKGDLPGQVDRPAVTSTTPV